MYVYYTLTGLISRCKKPTECILSIALSICKPKRKVVDRLKAARGCALLSSAKFLP